MRDIKKSENLVGHVTNENRMVIENEKRQARILERLDWSLGMVVSVDIGF